MINLGRLKLKNELILAPMQMYSDIAFRELCYGYGCGYAFSELIPTKEFISKKVPVQKIDFHDKIGIQFLSNNKIELKEAIRIVNEKESYPHLENVRSIDLNMGCPNQDIIYWGLGAGLLKEDKLVRELFRIMNKYSLLPISAKIRLGVNSKHKKNKPYLRIAKIAKEENLDFITIHGRTASQEYDGEVDTEAIKEVSLNVDMPLVGNGNIDDEISAENMLKFCDSVMIGKQAIKDPFIFQQIGYYLKNKKRAQFDYIDEKYHCIKKYLKLSEKYNVGFQHIKLHMQGFLKGIPGTEKAIEQLTHTKNKEDIFYITDKFIKND